jgi:hypothetical protein
MLNFWNPPSYCTSVESICDSFTLFCGQEPQNRRPSEHSVSIVDSWGDLTNQDMTVVHYTKPAEFKRMSIPLIRRIYPQLIMDQIMPMQPLQTPPALVYHLRNRHAET